MNPESMPLLAGRGLVSSLGETAEKVVAGLHEPAGSETTHLPDGEPFPYHPARPVEWQDPERIWLILEPAVEQALGQAGIEGDALADVPLFLGSSSLMIGRSEHAYRSARVEAGDAAIPLPESGYGRLATELGDRFGLGRQRYSFNTACTSSATALLYAAEHVADGRAEHALVVGVESLNELTVRGFRSLQLMAPERCRPFDAGRNGIVFGEGAAAVVLSRSGTGRWRWRGGHNGIDTTGVTASDPRRMAHVIRTALDRAGVSPGQLVATKAHGTGTWQNDLAELEAMAAVFESSAPSFASLKGALGHTLGGCGLIELVATTWAVERGLFPASTGFRETAGDAPVRPLEAPMTSRPGCYLFDYFGFGGSNTAYVMEWNGEASP